MNTLANRDNAIVKQEIEQFTSANRFCYGIEDVWRNAMKRKGNRLLVERDFTFPHSIGEPEDKRPDSVVDGPAFVRDGVDILIEMVLESGGEVRFADRSILKDFGHIGLFLYY